MTQVRVTHPTMIVSGPFGPDNTGTVFTAVEVPAGTYVARVLALVTVALDGGSPAIDVGDADDDDGWIDALQIDPLTPGLYDGRRLAVEANGTATIEDQTVTVAVTHGLGIAPGANDIVVTPTANWGDAGEFWVDDPTETDFDITVDTDPGEDVSFAWQARALVHADTPYYGGRYYVTDSGIVAELSAELTAGEFYIIAELWTIGGAVS